LKVHAGRIPLRTKSRLEITDITKHVNRIVNESRIGNGLVNIWTTHTTAAVAVNEHDTDLWEDILSTLTRLVPIRADYRHNAKYRWAPGEQNAHAHILSCLIKPNVTIPVQNGKMVLGTWQSILFIELDGPRDRSIQVHVMGE